MLVDITLLSNVTNIDNYFCTFDKSCTKYDNKPPYKSCEKGISACLTF